ncbi:unnamed protein product [Pararhodospirillum photometricum DSM 122]|uniref:Uncharacterized protein n=1 Tax=Pararhodospirillum photometricum DSM 122 TaxID=1150469 RepID=H6SN21_PARPM|nr:unnamed protein product [Pararhodospirillum photometricum DSM 122]
MQAVDKAMVGFHCVHQAAARRVYLAQADTVRFGTQRGEGLGER